MYFSTILDFEAPSGIIKNNKCDHLGIFSVLRTTLERTNINECIIRKNIKAV